MCRDDAPDLGRSFRSQTDRQQSADSGGGVLRRLKNAAGFRRQRHSDRIDIAHAGHIQLIYIYIIEIIT